MVILLSPTLLMVTVCVAVPIPEDLHQKPGAIFHDEGPDDEHRAKLLLFWAKRLRERDYHKFAVVDPRVAQLPVIKSKENPAAWVKDHLIIQVDEKKGTLRIWLDEGPIDQRAIIVDAIAIQIKEQIDKSRPRAQNLYEYALRKLEKYQKNYRTSLKEFQANPDNEQALKNLQSATKRLHSEKRNFERFRLGPRWAKLNLAQKAAEQNH